MSFVLARGQTAQTSHECDFYSTLIDTQEKRFPREHLISTLVWKAGKEEWSRHSCK